MTGMVYIVGAGTGEADMITVRGARLLSMCDTLIYDSLISEELLTMTRPGCKKIYAGKRAGAHHASQEEINRLIIAEAAAGGTVVRLKGGDPFVFGRGGEEAEAVAAAGIPYEIVPGVTSAVAAAEYAGIPVTHRDTARSFHVITAHTTDGLADVSKAAAFGGTLVILMGLRLLEEICRRLINGGMAADTPAAVVSKAGEADMRVVRAPLSNLSEKAKGMAAPAVIIVGDTAAFDLTPKMSTLRVGITGTPHMVRRFEKLFAGTGVKTYNLGFSDIAPIEFDMPSADEYDTLVFTSANGVRVFFDKLRYERMDIRTLADKKFSCIGTGTARELTHVGIIPDYCPENFTSEALGKMLAAQKSAAGRMLILRAELGSPELTQELAAAGAEYRDIKTYKIEIDKQRLEYARKTAGTTDAVIFPSSSAANAFFAGIDSAGFKPTAIAIGAKTSAAIERHGIKCRVAHRHTAEDVVKLCLELTDNS